ncbi:hypothetical protein V6Z11_A07G126600 [Gossypium hirsutum]
MSYGFYFCKTFFGSSFIQAAVLFPFFLSSSLSQANLIPLRWVLA